MNRLTSYPLLVFLDIDECITKTHKCDPNSYCSNTIGSYGCLCKEGFKMSDEGICKGEQRFVLLFFVC